MLCQLRLLLLFIIIIIIDLNKINTNIYFIFFNNNKKVTGTLEPVLNVLPSGEALTWAFATGKKGEREGKRGGRREREGKRGGEKGEIV